MILNKIFRHLKEKKIFDLKYIVVEILLIFTGITLAAKYNNYQIQLHDETFLQESISQIHGEIIEDNKINTHYSKFVNGRITSLNLVQEYLLNRNVDSINSITSMRIFSELPNTCTLSNSTLGFDRLKEKNLNLIKNSDLRNQLVAYYDHMSYNMKDLANFNTDIEKIKPFMFKHFRNYDFLQRKYDSIINVNDLFEDYAFENNIGFINSNFEIYGDIINSGIIPKANSLIKTLEKEYPFLIEEHK